MDWPAAAVWMGVIAGVSAPLVAWLMNRGKRQMEMEVTPQSQEEQSVLKRLDNLQEDVNKIEQQQAIQADRGKRSEDDIKHLTTEISGLKDMFYREVSLLKDMVMKRNPSGP